MKKYFVIADTYQRAYGCEYYLFGIFDTKEEAVNWIIEHSVICLEEPDEEEGYEGSYHNFLLGYEEGKGAVRKMRDGVKRYTPMTKEEYISRSRYIREFNDEPMYIGGYQE